VHARKDSDTYQAIVEEGKIQARQDVLFELGRKKFGPISPEIERRVRATTDLDRLAFLNERLLDVSSWQELLASS